MRFILAFAVFVLCLHSEADESVARYGAVGDGKVNDTAAFAAAFKASKRVTIPAGTYRLDSVAIPAGCSLTGEDETATVLLDSGGTTQLIDGSRAFVSCIDAPGASLRNVTIRGRGWVRSASDVGLLLHAAPNFVARNITIERFAGIGLWMHHKLTANCELNTITIRNISEEAPTIRHGWGCLVYGGGNYGAANYNTFRDLRIENTAQAGLAFDAGTSTGAGNAVIGNAVFGLTMKDCGVVSRGGAAALCFSGAQSTLVSNVRMFWTGRPTGPAIVFARDQTLKAVQDNVVCGGAFISCWNTTPIATENSTGTNQLIGITLMPFGGAPRAIGVERF